MSASLLFLLLTVEFVVAGLVLYALSRNRNVKAFCKLPFAVVVGYFEIKLIKIEWQENCARLFRRGMREMSTTNRNADSQIWTIEINQQRFEDLKTSDRFCQLVALARVVNALRFVQAPLLTSATKDTPEAHRTRYNSFFFTSALLFEGMLLVERLAKHFRDVPEFKTGLWPLLKDHAVTDLRKLNLKQIRNTLVFHFGEDEVRAQLARSTNIAPRFTSGAGNANINVYHQLADLCALGSFLGQSLDSNDSLEKLRARVDETTLI